MLRVTFHTAAAKTTTDSIVSPATIKRAVEERRGRAEHPIDHAGVQEVEGSVARVRVVVQAAVLEKAFDHDEERTLVVVARDPVEVVREERECQAEADCDERDGCVGSAGSFGGPEPCAPQWLD